MDVSCISYKNTGFFSSTVTDYLEGKSDLKPFYGERPDFEGFDNLLKSKKVIANRETLANVLNEQYQIIVKYARIWDASFTISDAVQQNIELLRADNTYTITTGHQLNIFAGPLYFIYKIVTAIKLAQQLKEKHPDKNFVPIYWMASEDHDFAEISYTYIGGKKVHWWLDASGATGRINPETMRQALNQYKGVLGIENYGAELAAIVETAYTRFDKLADATRYMVNALFGKYGLVIIDADNTRLKKQFAPIIEQDIFEQNSFKNIAETNQNLQNLGVHIQVNPREINFFYMKGGTLRERLIFEDGLYKVHDTEITFTAEQLREQINKHPERFSPNVVMRPLYQECILPNIAYVGGGAEVVYWLELKSNFDFYKVDFPILILRNSAMVVRKESAGKIKRMELQLADLFKSTDAIKNDWVKKHSDNKLSLQQEWAQIQAVFAQIKANAAKIDPTLGPSTEAVQVRLKKAIDNLEKKLVKAEKHNYQTRLEQIDQIKEELFPNGLQERTENFGMLYVRWGQNFIDELIRHFEPLDFEFAVLTE